ncbi:hypothetical protein V1507DRAFT_65689 [Lipomyces tetrasporus]
MQHWRRESPTNGWTRQDIQTNSLETQVPKLDDKIMLFSKLKVLEVISASTTLSLIFKAHGGVKEMPWFSLMMTRGHLACTVLVVRLFQLRVGPAEEPVSLRWNHYPRRRCS